MLHHEPAVHGTREKQSMRHAQSAQIPNQAAQDGATGTVIVLDGRDARHHRFTAHDHILVSRSKSVWQMGLLVTENLLLPAHFDPRAQSPSAVIKVRIKSYTSCDAYFPFTTRDRACCVA